MLQRALFWAFSVAAVAVILAAGEQASAQSQDSNRRTDSDRRTMGNLNPNPPRRSPGNFPPGQPNYYSQQGNQSSGSRGPSSGTGSVVVPNPSYPGWYYPAVPAYRVPVYPPYGSGSIYVPAPGYYYGQGYYPYYYPPRYYVVPRYPYAF
ncbi:MAG: hypothetical protein ACYC6Y_08030 [Thermoguttaceae bacterium]